MTTSLRASTDGPILHVGSRKQLFIDKRFIRADEGIYVTMNQPVKMESVIRPEKPWELGWITGNGTVLEDQGTYRMWYPVLPPTGPIADNADNALLCYAESDDGVYWTKPNLGIQEWQGSKANNILLQAGADTCSIFIDPRAADSEKYKLLAVFFRNEQAPNGPGIYIYASSDGLRWRLNPTVLFPFTPDTQNQAFYDARIDKYVIYVRAWNPLRTVGRVETDDILKPWPYTPSAIPYLLFGPNAAPAPSTEVDTAFAYDERDPQPSDHYTSAAVPYPWAQDAYFMFPSAYRHYPGPPAGRFENDGPVDIQLASSRDGVTYQRVDRKPYIELGLAGTQDGGSLYMLVGLLRRGDEIYQYYGAFPFTHGAYKGLPEERRIGAIMRVRQRLDGFVSADADMAGGSFTTPPLRFQGRQLTLNLNASAMGEVLVEVREATGEPIQGYTFADCDPLHRNHTALVVTWNGSADVSTNADRPVQLTFRLRAAKLYAFQFGP